MELHVLMDIQARRTLLFNNDMCLNRRPVQCCTNVGQGRRPEIFLKKF